MESSITTPVMAKETMSRHLEMFGELGRLGLGLVLGFVLGVGII